MQKNQIIAALGTGIMGFQMTRRLCQTGFRVNVWNRSIDNAEPLKNDGACIFTASPTSSRGGRYESRKTIY